MDPDNRLQVFNFAMCLLLAQVACTAFGQNSMIGDGFGGRLWYRPTNYAVGSYTAYSICYSDPCDSSSNQLYGWGSDELGQLGNGNGAVCSDVPVLIPGMSDVRYFTGGYVSGAIKNDGTGWIWFDNWLWSTPTQVIADVKFVDVGIFTECFVKEDGTVWSIMNNQFGQFGDGTTTDSYTAPVQMAGVANAVRVAVGYYANYVLRSDGSVLAVGSSFNGSLGDPSLTDTLYTTPFQVPGLSNIVDLKANSAAVAALDANGDVFCWGLGGYTGDGDQLNDTLPVRVTALRDIVAISGCNDGVHFLALDAYGNCFAWGDYNLGTQSSGEPPLLAPFLLATDVIDIMAGERFSYIVNENGELWAEGWSQDCSIWLNFSDTLRTSFTRLDLDQVPEACPLVGTVAVPSTDCVGTSFISVSHFGGQPPYVYDIGTGPQTNPVFNSVPPGNYTVTVTDAAGCVITVPCAVAPEGPDPMVLLMGAVSNCLEEGYALPSGEIVYEPGNYMDTVLYDLGCDTVRIFSVSLTPLPRLIQQVVLCEGGSFTLSNGVVVQEPGEYFIDTLEYADACDTIYSELVVLSTQPNGNGFIDAQESEVVPGDSTLLFASAGVYFNWWPSTGLACAACPFTMASPPQSTEYCVSISNIDGCLDTACVLITVITPPPPICTAENIFIPTAFSPNATGTNDMQCVYGGECIKTMTFGIYDRWGNKVFESTDPKACWDGTYNGQALDPAVFVYHLSATLINGEILERQGNITLVR